MSRVVTERDFRDPRFRDADPADYEFRDDGQIVRKDRWEMGIRRIRGHLGDPRREFEIDDIVSAVEALVSTIEKPAEDLRMTCACIPNINRQIAANGSELHTLTPHHADGTTGTPRVLVRTRFIDPATEKLPPIAVATHCPFCGTKYED